MNGAKGDKGDLGLQGLKGSQVPWRSIYPINQDAFIFKRILVIYFVLVFSAG